MIVYFYSIKVEGTDRYISGAFDSLDLPIKTLHNYHYIQNRIKRNVANDTGLDIEKLSMISFNKI